MNKWFPVSMAQCAMPGLPRIRSDQATGPSPGTYQSLQSAGTGGPVREGLASGVVCVLKPCSLQR